MYAVTIFDNGIAGLLAWAGRLHPSALKKTGEQIEPHDYMEQQTVGFHSWEEAWAYFERQPKFSSLVPQLRIMVEKENELSADT